MSRDSIRRSAYIGGISLGAIGLASSAVLMSTPAGADPKLPSNVWIQVVSSLVRSQPFPII